MVFIQELLNLEMFNQINASLLKLHFSEREIKVLDLIAEGLSNEEIGDKLFVSKRTVEGIRHLLLSKTGSKNTAALMAFAFRSGLLI